MRMKRVAFVVLALSLFMTGCRQADANGLDILGATHTADNTAWVPPASAGRDSNSIVGLERNFSDRLGPVPASAFGMSVRAIELAGFWGEMGSLKKE